MTNKERHQIYELFNYADGNDDILSDTGDSGDIKRGMWAQVPYSVSDGPGVINEEFIDFVNNRDTYPEKSVSNLPFLNDRFHECMKNIDEVMEVVEDKEKFLNNLKALQEYIIRRGFFEEKLLPEDGSAKFSTDDAMGQDGFPPYNQGADTSPSINNDLDANIAMYEDLIYNHIVGDATDDEYMLSEVVAKTPEEVDSFISGSKVKETVYHGSPVGGLEDFKVKGGGDDGQIVTSSGLREDGMFFTSNPKVADMYRGKKLTPEFKNEIEHQIYRLEQIQNTVRNNREFDEIGNEIEKLRNKLLGDIYRVKLKIKNPLIFDGKGKSNSFDGSGWDELQIDLGYKIARGKEVIRLIGEKSPVAKDYWKYDGIIGKNIIELDSYTNRLNDENSEYVGNVYAVFSPDQVLIVNEVEAAAEMVNERNKSFATGSKTVKVKRKCQLGGLPDGTSVACNQGDINNLEFGSVNDGVGDKYAEKFGVKPEFTDFDKKYMEKKSVEQNQVLYNKHNLVIIKNPVDLKNIGSSVRGIIDSEGNLYLEQRSVGIHQELVDKLQKLGLVKMGYIYSVGETLPSEYISVQRFGDSNKIVIGEANHQMRQYTRLYDKAVPVFQKFIDAAKRKNPNIEFVNEYINDYRSYQGYDNLEDLDINEYFSSLVPSNENQMQLNKTNIMRIQDLPFRQEVEQLGGEIYAVGGAVRDEVLGKDSKDLDIVVRGIPEDKLAEILNRYGKVNAVGESFAVTKFVPNGSTEEIDIALPRTEKSTGEGHKDFEIISDYRLPIEKDLERRDFTINAIAKDMDGNVIDPFNGMADLKSGTIRVTYPESFRDDALRMLRAVQFASRFDFDIDPETYKQIVENAPAIKTVVKERIQEELLKIVEKGDAHKGAFLLKDTGLLRQMGVDAPLLVSNVWDNVNTIAEYVYLLSHNAINPISFYMNNMRGDSDVVSELKGLIVGMEAQSYDNPIINRSTAHNMILKSNGLKALESQILPQQLQVAAQELLQGKYPKTVKDLAVDGNDLMAKGLRGKAIGDMHKAMLIKVYADKVRNDKEELLSLVDDANVVKEGFAQYSQMNPDTWSINDEDVDINFFVDKYDKWNEKTATSSGHYSDPTRASVLEFLQNNYEDFSVDDKLNKHLFWKLMDREFLSEGKNDRQIEYGALMLYLDVPVWEKITSIIKKEDVFEKDGEYGIETEPHVTILYGFHNEVDANDVFDLYKENFELKPIEIGVEGVSVFENEEFDVVKMDVSSKILSKMNSVMRELPNTTDFPKYHAHITLAYVKKDTGKNYIKAFEKNRMLVGNELVFSTKKEKRKKLKLSAKGVLNEDKVEKIAYSAVVLDDKSRTALLKVFQAMIPEGWEVIAHHMTIKMGALPEDSVEKQDMIAEKIIMLHVQDYAIDDKVMAVSADGYETKNDKPHITIAVNRADGGKPFLSNKLSDWRPLGFPLELTGKIVEVKR